jgi:hypothetical protein
MQFMQFLRWYPVYWFLTVIGQLTFAIGLSFGAAAGALLFGLFFALPPKSGWQAFVFLALTVAGGFYGATRLSGKWESAIRRITERMKRDMRR